MQKTRILWNNLWRQGNLFSKTSESPQFSAVYTQDDDTTLHWRSTAVNVAQDLAVDLGSAQEYNEIIILNHNLTAGATITLYGADDAGFLTNVVTDTITYNGSNIRNFLAATRTKRYILLHILNTTNPDGYIKIGTIGLGKFLDLGVVVSGEGYEDGISDETQIEFSPSRNLFITQSKPVLISRPMSHTHLTDAVKDSILQLLHACGHHYAMDFCLDYTAPNTYSTWAVLTEAARVKYVSANHWRWDIEILEHV